MHFNFFQKTSPSKTHLLKPITLIIIRFYKTYTIYIRNNIWLLELSHILTYALCVEYIYSIYTAQIEHRTHLAAIHLICCCGIFNEHNSITIIYIHDVGHLYRIELSWVDMVVGGRCRRMALYSIYCCIAASTNKVHI